MSSSTMNLFEKISEDLRPTPIHPHYIFTQHDIARIFQGMMLLSARTKTRTRAKTRKKSPKKDGRKVKGSDKVHCVVDEGVNYGDGTKKTTHDESELDEKKG